MNHLINNNLPLHLNHSVQTYWMNIGFVMTNVMNRMQNQLNQEFALNLNVAIQTAHNCANFYGLLRRGEIEENQYTNTEQLFYLQLEELINNSNQFTNELQNAVHAEVDLGTRYFNRFIDMVQVNYID